MSEKVTGYILLGLGLLIVGYAAYSVIMTLTGATQPLALFNSPGISIDTATLMPGQKGSIELFSAKDLNLFSNLTIHYLLMTFLVSVGYKISTLGIQLLRTIEVKVNQKST